MNNFNLVFTIIVSMILFINNNISNAQETCLAPEYKENKGENDYVVLRIFEDNYLASSYPSSYSTSLSNETLKIGEYSTALPSLYFDGFNLCYGIYYTEETFCYSGHQITETCQSRCQPASEYYISIKVSKMIGTYCDTQYSKNYGIFIALPSDNEDGDGANSSSSIKCSIIFIVFLVILSLLI